MTTATEPRTVLAITAAELRPGDLILTADGGRAFAAFDVDTAGTSVIVYTGVTDQERGYPDRFPVAPSLPLTVSRRDGGPRVTRVTVIVPTSATPDDERYDRDSDALGPDADMFCAYCRGVLVHNYDGPGSGWSHWFPTPGTRLCTPPEAPTARPVNPHRIPLRRTY